MKRQTLSVSLCIMVLLIAVMIADAETLFFDDFEDGLDKWPDLAQLTIDTDPEKAGNNVLVVDPAGGGVDALIMDGFENADDYTMTARFNIIKETADYSVAGLIVRAQTETTYMLVEPANNRQGVKGIVNVFERGAAWPIVADGPFDIQMNQWYDIAVAVSKDVLTVSIDDTEIAEYDSVAYPQGGFGIRQWQATALFDDIEVFDSDGSSLSVDPQQKLTTTWASVKAIRP